MIWAAPPACPTSRPRSSSRASTSERQLAPWLTGTASYSRRITYPPIQLLNPALNFQDATTAQAGNPLLQPQLTDSYEVRLRANLAPHNLELTAFRRTTEDIWSFRGEVNPDGVLVTRPFNFGAQALTGAELSARGPLARGAALRAHRQRLRPGPRPGRRRPAAEPAQRHLCRAPASSNIGTARTAGAGADRVNLTLRYFGPTDTGFTRVNAFALATFTWSHAITDRLSGVLTRRRISGCRTGGNRSPPASPASRATCSPPPRPSASPSP